MEVYNDDFNSSDLEPDPVPDNPFAHLGKRSLEQMSENTLNDRINSKRAVRNLKQNAGTLSAQYHQELVWNRFQGFYANTLKKE